MWRVVGQGGRSGKGRGVRPMRRLATLVLTGAILGGAAGGCGSGSTPTPTHTSLAAGTALPTVTATPIEAAPSASPTPPASPIQTSLVIPTDSPNDLAALRLRLKNWLNGSIKVPTSKLWKDQSSYPDLTVAHPASPFTLNLAPSSASSYVRANQYPGWSPFFQGYLLGTAFVKDKSGVDDVVVYIGQQDGRANRYYVPVNLGSYAAAFKVYFGEIPSRVDAFSGYESVFFSRLEARGVLDTLVNETILFPVLGYHPDWASTSATVDLDDLRASENVQVQYANFGLRAAPGSYVSAMATYPLVKAMINREVTIVDPAALIFASIFYIPITGLYNPSPLPVTVSSSDYLTNTFVLSPGTYAVAYTASGTCDFNPSVSILGSVSIPVVHQSVESESVSGTASITVLKIGRYLLDPGSYGCDWYVTIGQP